VPGLLSIFTFSVSVLRARPEEIIDFFFCFRSPSLVLLRLVKLEIHALASEKSRLCCSFLSSFSICLVKASTFERWNSLRASNSSAEVCWRMLFHDVDEVML